MNRLLPLIFILSGYGGVQKIYAQESLSLQHQQLLEQLSASSSLLSEDESLAEFLEHPLAINQSTEADWIALGLVPMDKINQLMEYKKLMGMLTSIYELQAVPGWDPEFIRTLLPYVQLSEPVWIEKQFADRFKKGKHDVQWRSGIASHLIQESGSFQGDPTYQYLKYRYQYKKLLRWNVMVEKDAGEVLFNRAGALGVDMISAHIAISNIGPVKELVLGDYTVQLGQGLLIWQGLAFGKSLSLLGVKRQGISIKPYQSSGEFNFFRGGAMNLKYKKWEITPFVSMRKLDAVVENDSMQLGQQYMKSWVTAGYHRSSVEISHQSKQRVFASGWTMHHQFHNFRWGIQFITQKFGIPLSKGVYMYEKFELEGGQLQSASIDYSKNIGAVHLFGEFAKSSPGGLAFVQGLLMHPDPSLGLAILYRNISPRYISLYGNAFTERSVVQNEKGVYVGVNYKLGQRWQWDAYWDHYNFPWLTFRADAPSYGMDFQMQLTHTPNKKVTFQTRLHREAAYRNISMYQDGFRRMFLQRQWQWRTDYQQKINSQDRIHLRMEWMWVADTSAVFREVGFLLMGSVAFKPVKWIKKVDVSISYIETTDGTFRLYHYEPDVGAGYAVRGYSGQGVRWAMILRKEWKLKDVQKSLGASLKMSQTFHPATHTIASEFRLMFQRLW